MTCTSNNCFKKGIEVHSECCSLRAKIASGKQIRPEWLERSYMEAFYRLVLSTLGLSGPLWASLGLSGPLWASLDFSEAFLGRPGGLLEAFFRGLGPFKKRLPNM